MIDLLEKFVKKYKATSFIIVVLLVMSSYFIAISISIAPAYMILLTGFEKTREFPLWLRGLIFGGCFCFAYFSFAVTLMFSVSFLNFIFPFKLKPWRGRYYSLKIIPWYYHNALVQLVRFTVLDILTPSPLNTLFFKMMGMKMGKNCIINTSNISDPALITLGDNVTIGGSATIFAHYGQAGNMIIAPVILKSGATIGLKASIMGDVVIGENVLVKPHEVILPKTRLEKD